MMHLLRALTAIKGCPKFNSRIYVEHVVRSEHRFPGVDTHTHTHDKVAIIAVSVELGAASFFGIELRADLAKKGD